MQMTSVAYDDLLDALEILEDECIQIQKVGRHWRVSANAPIERRRVQHYNMHGQPVDGNSEDIAFAVEIITRGNDFVDAHVIEDDWEE